MTVRDAYLADVADVARLHLDQYRRDGTNPFQPADAIERHQEVVRQMIRSRARPGDRVLDAGCAIGTTLAVFDDLDRYGVDIVGDYLTVAEGNGLATVQADLEAIPHEDGSFDMVLCTDVLEHVLDLNAVMRELVRVLRPGGHLIIRVPFEEDLTEYLGIPWRYVHLRRFDRPTLFLLFDRIFGLVYVEDEISAVGRSREIAVVGRKP